MSVPITGGGHRFPFGLLEQPTRAVAFRCGEVRPLEPEGYRHQTWGQEHGHADGWLYPSTLGWKKGVAAPDGSELEEDWPANEPKPDIWKLKPTHELIWSTTTSVGTERHLPAIVINALGWAYGNRVQFADWQVDGRVRWKCSPSFGLRMVHAGYFLDRIIETVEALPARHRRDPQHPRPPQPRTDVHLGLGAPPLAVRGPGRLLAAAPTSRTHAEDSKRRP